MMKHKHEKHKEPRVIHYYEDFQEEDFYWFDEDYYHDYLYYGTENPPEGVTYDLISI